MVEETLRALEGMEGAGADAEVVDLRTLEPLDVESIVTSVARTGRCLVIHEAVEKFGPGAELVARIVEDALYDLDGPVARFGALPTPVPYSPSLESEMLPTHESIASRLAAVARS
jgi:pyruvate/2-oxoglutarate/acetoin dehydrogenase E1 component